MTQSQSDLFLGGSTPSDEVEQQLRYPRSALTTHGVIVGMTGSGKTGLGVVLLEEVLRSGVPALVIDPKGDMGNLALGFDTLSASDFSPWIDSNATQRSEQTVAEASVETAEHWRKGLGQWGLGAQDVASLGATAEVCVWTPGSSVGQPINVLGSLRAPQTPFDDDAEALRAEIESFVSSFLVLAGIEADPISSKEHILLSHLIERAWRAGRDLEIGDLILEVADPPLRRLGVFELDEFFPARSRNKLAMRLNAVIASPSFSVWMKGPALDIETLLFTADGRPRGSVIYLPHLEEAQRQFVVTLLLSKVVTWMRRQPGTSDLRALVYMDEVFGFAPPTENPPSKRPILTLLKQARAHGVGVVLATQNPVDLDYKAMSNAGTWMVGRLSTERDKARIIEALRSSGTDADYESLIGGLAKRSFLLYSTDATQPKIFQTRWALSYLRGPMTLNEIARLEPPADIESQPEDSLVSAPTEVERREEPPSVRMQRTSMSIETPQEPWVSRTIEAASTDVQRVESVALPGPAKGVPVAFARRSASWLAFVGGDPDGRCLKPVVLVRMQVAFELTAGRLTQEWELVLPMLSETFDVGQALHVDWDERDITEQAPVRGRPLEVGAPIDSMGWWSRARQALQGWAQSTGVVRVFRNRALGLMSRSDESKELFIERCKAVAMRRSDTEASSYLSAQSKQMIDWKRQLEQTQYKLNEAMADAASAIAADEQIERTAALMNATIRGFVAPSKLAAAIERRQLAEDRQRGLLSRHQDLQEAFDALAERERHISDAVVGIHRAWLSQVEVVDEEIADNARCLELSYLGLLWVPSHGE